MRPDFNRCENIANALLADQQVTSFPLDVRNLTYDIPIVFDTFSNYCDHTGLSVCDLTIHSGFRDGFTIMQKDFSLVLYNDCIFSNGRIIWTLAHELGHVLLQHPHHHEPYETEAHIFAGKLLAPDVVLLELMNRGIILDPEDLVILFGLSSAAANSRLSTFKNRIRKGRKRDYYDDIILEMFLPYIDSIAPETSKKEDCYGIVL